jgi:hypothetical protein
VFTVIIGRGICVMLGEDTNFQMIGRQWLVTFDFVFDCLKLCLCETMIILATVVIVLVRHDEVGQS